MATSIAAHPMDDEQQKQRQHVLHSLRSKGLVIPDEPGTAIDQNQFGADGPPVFAGGRGGKGELISPVTRISSSRGRQAPSTFSHENLNHKLGLIPTLSAILPLLSPNNKGSSILSPRSDGGKPFAFPLTPTTRLPARALAPDYRRIEDHGVIGNMCTVALVGTDACIDWFCYPCFDSPSVFSSILDHKIGGFYSIRASNSTSARMDAASFDTRGVGTSQSYLANTNVLVTRFTSEKDDAVAQVQDFMPVPLPSVSVDKEKGSGRSWLIRSLEMIRGSMWFEVQCCPAFNYAQDPHEVQTLPHGARFISPKLTLVLTSSRAHYWGPSSAAAGGVSLYIQLREGEREVFTLREDDDHYYLSRFQTGALSPTTPICKAYAFPSPARPTEGSLNTTTTNHNNNSSSNMNNNGSAPFLQARDEPFLISPLPRAAVAVANETISLSFERVAADSEQPASSSSQIPGRPDDLTPEHPLPTPSPTHGLPPEMRGEDVSGQLHKSTFDVPFVPVELSDRLYRKTVKFWLRWIEQCTYKGRWRQQVVRSALALKLMTFAPTGALVAAPTCSLPECIGGNRNWDYRYCWLRDSSFMLRALLMLGFKEEAVAFLSWLERRCLAQEMDVDRVDKGMQIMYGLRGEKRLDESTLDHFGGYMGSGPVRIGNAAVEQLQMDIYGEMLDMIWYCDQNAEPISDSLWTQTRNLVEFVVRHWRAKDNSIWEVRGGMQHFVYSKVMCWTALDRGIKLAEARNFEAPLDRWYAVKKEIYDDIQVNGYNEQKKAFVQSYNSDSLDAACLFLPIVGFMPPTDPRIKGTLDAICRTTDRGGLMSDNMVFRYDVESTDDGFKGIDEGTFSICTFWAVEALAMTGLHNPEYLKRSLQIFNDTIRKGNHVDLFSEEISVKGGALGNFPQGFTHLAIIRAAVYLDHALSSRAALPFELRQENEVDEREYNHVSASSASTATPIHGTGSAHAHGTGGQIFSPNHALTLNQILARPAYTRHLSHFSTNEDGASRSTTFTMPAPATMPAAANGRQRAQTFSFR